MPTLTRVLETALYVADLDRAAVSMVMYWDCLAFTRTTGCEPMM